MVTDNLKCNLKQHNQEQLSMTLIKKSKKKKKKKTALNISSMDTNEKIWHYLPDPTESGSVSEQVQKSVKSSKWKQKRHEN